MADVTSTARLIVEVIGEDKVKALARDLAALKKAGGSFTAGAAGARGGVKGGLAEFAGARAGTKAGLRSALGASIGAAAGAATAKLSKEQGKALLAAVAPAAAATAAQAKLTQAQGKALLNALEPIKTATVAAPKTIATPIVSGIAEMTAAQKIAASIAKRTGERREEVEARLAKGPQKLFPLTAAEEARRTGAAGAVAAGGAARGAAAAAGGAGLAEGLAGVGMAGLAARAMGLVLSPITVGVTAAVLALREVAQAMAEGSEAAQEHSKKTIKLAGEAKRTGLTMDEIQERRIAGERILGEQYDSVDKKLPKLLASRSKQAQADLKALGISKEQVAQFEKENKRRIGAADVSRKILEKREDLQNKIAQEGDAKRKAALEKSLRDFDTIVGRKLGKDAADALAARTAKEADQALADAKRATGFGPRESPEKQIENAKRIERENAQRAANAAALTDRLGSGVAESYGKMLESMRVNIQEKLGVPLADLKITLANIGFNAVTAALNALGPAADAAASGITALNEALSKKSFQPLLDLLTPKDTPEDDAKTAEDKRKEWQKWFEELITPPDVAPDEGEAPKSAQETLAEAFKTWVKKIISPITGEKPPGAEIPLPKPRPEEAPQAPASQQLQDALNELSNATKSLQQILQPKEPIKVDEDKIFGGEGTEELRGSGEEISGSISEAAAGFAATATAGIVSSGSEGGNAFGTASQAGIISGGQSGGAAFSSAATAGIVAAGSAGGAAFNSAVNGAAIGSAIGSAAAAIISSAKVNVNVNVAGGGGAVNSGKSTGSDKPAPSD